MIALRSGFCILSTTTEPCIWYAIPIAPMSFGLYKPLWCVFFIASLVSAHQVNGSCSAHPALSERMGASDSGNLAETIRVFVVASTTETFIDDVPKSIPNNNILCILKSGYTVQPLA